MMVVLWKSTATMTARFTASATAGSTSGRRRSRCPPAATRSRASSGVSAVSSSSVIPGSDPGSSSSSAIIPRSSSSVTVNSSSSGTKSSSSGSAIITSSESWFLPLNPLLSYGTMTDGRDGKKYATIALNGYTVMAQNLDYGTQVPGMYATDNQSNDGGGGEKYCYNDSSLYC